MTIPDMNEFILWPNCPGSCKFCWYKKMKPVDTYLSIEEKRTAINAALEYISSTGNTDVLFVGGELLDETNLSLKEDLLRAFTFIRDREQVRFFYINTSLMYKDTTLVAMLCEVFKNCPEKLRLTTSYDLVGRFRSNTERDRFLSNLSHITSTTKLNVVVNTILTKTVCESDFNAHEFCKATGAYYVHLLPYVPLSDDDPERPTFGQFVNKLAVTDKLIPGYLKSYIENIELPQEKYVWEFDKVTGTYQDKAAAKSDCGHNVNFKSVLGSTCFACELKALLPELISS